MDIARGPRGRSRSRPQASSRARAAGLGCVLVALALTAACASRTPSTGSALAPGWASPAASSPAASSPSGTSTTSSARDSAPSSDLPTPTTSAPRSAASANTRISCTATVSNPTPKRGLPTHVIVQTVSGAQVFVAAMSAVDTSVLVPRQSLSADADGRVDLTIAAPTAGTKITVQVQTAKAGTSASCATSFTPVDLPRVSDSPGLPPIQITTQPIPPANDNT